MAKLEDKDKYRWSDDKGDSTHRINYELTEDSVVFDLGGYKGEWSNIIFNRYGSNVFIFEPISSFYNIIKNAFNNNSKIKTYNFGVGDKDEIMDINLSDTASSVFFYENHRNTGGKEQIIIKNFCEFLDQENIKKVDLIKINIEGSEYDLLESLIKNEKIEMFQNIQVQFHEHVPNCIERRNAIREILTKTHNITYEYEFIWENWQKK